MEPKKIPVTFTTTFDLFVSDAVRHIASGTAPNLRVAVLLNNSEVPQEKLTPELQAECRAAWKEGEESLAAFVRRNFFPSGRAEQLRFWNE